MASCGADVEEEEEEEEEVEVNCCAFNLSSIATNLGASCCCRSLVASTPVRLEVNFDWFCSTLVAYN